MNYFKLKENNTNKKTEIIAGITMFMAMAYELIVATNILSQTGMNKNGIFVATALSASVATLLIGILYNKIIIMGPSTGVLSYLTYTFILTLGYSWELGLFAVFVEGIILLILAITNLTEKFINAIPDSLKYGISVGIGLFLAFIGLKISGITVGSSLTLLTIGNFKNPQLILCLLGVLIIGILSKKNIRGSILIGIILTYILTIICQLIGIGNFNVIPNKIIDFNIFNGLSGTAFHLNGLSTIGDSLNNILAFAVCIFTLIFIDLSNNTGTVVGVEEKLEKAEQNPQLKELIIPSSIGSITSSLLGSVSITSYLETTSGIIEGGRTGLSSVVAAVCILLTLFFAPIIINIPAFVVSPAIIYLGMIMISPIKKIDFTEISECLPAFLTILIIPFTNSISDGILIGGISYVLIKVLTNNKKEIKKETWVLFIFLVIVFIITKMV